MTQLKCSFQFLVIVVALCETGGSFSIDQRLRGDEFNFTVVT